MITATAVLFFELDAAEKSLHNSSVHSFQQKRGREMIVLKCILEDIVSYFGMP